MPKGPRKRARAQVPNIQGRFAAFPQAWLHCCALWGRSSALPCRWQQAAWRMPGHKPCPRPHGIPLHCLQCWPYRAWEPRCGKRLPSAGLRWRQSPAHSRRAVPAGSWRHVCARLCLQCCTCPRWARHCPQPCVPCRCFFSRLPWRDSWKKAATWPRPLQRMRFTTLYALHPPRSAPLAAPGRYRHLPLWP